MLEVVVVRELERRIGEQNIYNITTAATNS
jgi:hypothetical protein